MPKDTDISDEDIVDAEIIVDEDDLDLPIFEEEPKSQIIATTSKDVKKTGKSVTKSKKKGNKVSDTKGGERPTLNQIIETQTIEYLQSIDVNNPPEPSFIERELLERINMQISIANEMTGGMGNEYGFLYRLSNVQIAHILSTIHTVVRVTPSAGSDPDNDVLAIYNDSGKHKGIYTTSRTSIRKIARQYHYNLNENEFKDVEIALRDIVPQVEVTSNPDYVPVNNGIFNYKTKELMPFNKDIIVLAKSSVNYNQDAVNPHITEPTGEIWDIESWMSDLSDDPEIVESLWQIIGATLRPYVSWNKSAWLYSEEGNNGKGTFCSLMRNLVGKDSCADIPLDKFGQEFYLERLVGSTAIIVDENNTDSYIDKAANMKAVITGDVITVNRKGKPIISYEFHGFMTQCLNGYPRVKDKSQSFYRRQLFIPMDKKFEGREKKYIKNDYLTRKDVLEYVLKRVLYDSNYYELSIPQKSLEVLEDFKISNDPVREFWDEFSSRFVWDLLPYEYLYDLYLAWSAKNNPSGSPLGSRNFKKSLTPIVNNDPQWNDGNRKVIRSGIKMNKPESINIEYNLTKWLNSNYTGTDPDVKAMFNNAMASYRGIERIPLP